MAMGISGRELLLEMRAELRSLNDKIDVVMREQAVGTERRAAMQAKVALVDAQLASHAQAIADLQKWRDEAAGALRLARWALGTSLLASVLLIIQLAAMATGQLP